MTVALVRPAPARTAEQTTPAQRAAAAPAVRFRYLHRRGAVYYFKRRIPAAIAHAFPEYRDQVWRSLDTTLLETAKVRLAVEVAEFELRAAAARRELASQTTDDWPGRRKPGPVSQAQEQAAGAPSDAVHASPAPKAVVPPAARPDTRRRDDSQAVAAAAKSTPAQPSRRQLAQRPTMLHLFEDWKRGQTRARSVAAVHTTVMEFRTQHGPIAVEELTKAHARAFRDQLIERGLSKSTILNKLGFLSTLVRHGQRELVEHLVLNPFERIPVMTTLSKNKPKERRAYTVPELNQLYASKLYNSEGYRPEGQARDAAYWLPLMGPFTGARIEELCQLRLEDVQLVNGVWCIRICDLGDDQEVKTLSSFRRVPLHEDLIRCGLLVYAAQMAKAGHDRLFPTLSNHNSSGIYSNSVGKWYGRYLETIGLKDHRLDYHSFRYLIRQQFSLCGVEEEVRDAATGHWLGNSNSGRTYLKGENRQFSFPRLVDAFKRLRYEELRIEHLFVPDPFDGVEVLVP